MAINYDSYLSRLDVKSLFSCSNGYVDSEDCSWYHENWMTLRSLNLVSNPFWHEQFFSNRLGRQLKDEGKVLVLGTADFSMPLLCTISGIKQVDICDICQTPLNICHVVAKQNNLRWVVYLKDVRDLAYRQYNVIVNDAFLTRFNYNEMSQILQHIERALTPGGIYITTIRNDWNDGHILRPSQYQKQVFIEKAIDTASEKGLDTDYVRNAAHQYINRITSYPMRNKKTIFDIAKGVFEILECDIVTVPGECEETTYFQVVFKKMSC